MKFLFRYLKILIGSLLLMNCKESAQTPQSPNDLSPTAEVKPVNINEKGFEFMQRMQGQWVGRNQVLGWDWPWFAFDYRAVSESHVFGIFEGGSMGNLLTSFFVSDFKNTRTIMARNGGLLSGIYRTSYFVLDSVQTTSEGDYYRFVDAIGGEKVMFMELWFKDDELEFNAYTSRLGERTPPSRHMAFKGARADSSLAQAAAVAFGYPTKNPAFDFSKGFNQAWLYNPPKLNQAVSATFMDMDSSRTVYDMANTSGDPVRIQDHTNMAALRVQLESGTANDNFNTLIYLSKDPLVNGQGQMDFQALETLLLFPELSAGQHEFLLTYLHSGSYYITAFSDRDADGSPGTGDYASVSQSISLNPQDSLQINLNRIEHEI